MAVAEDVPLSIWEHLDELRKRLIYALLGWFLATAAAWSFADRILRWLIRPPVDKLVFTHPAEPFLALVRISLVAGIGISLPWLFFQAWAFVAPGLKPAERRWVLGLIGPAYALFLAGGALGLFIIAPTCMRFLLSFSSTQLQPFIALEAYLKYVSFVAVGTGGMFQLPILVFVLAKIGIVTADTLAKYRRHVFLGILIAAAVLTPSPDVVGQLLISLPAYLLYEASIWAVRLTV